MIPQYEISKVVKFREIQCRLAVSKGLRGEEMGSFLFKGLEFQFCQMKKTSGILPHHNMNRFNPNKLHTYIVKFSFLQKKKEKNL